MFVELQEELFGIYYFPYMNTTTDASIAIKMFENECTLRVFFMIERNEV